MFYVCDGRRHLLRRASMAAPKDGGPRRGRRAAGGGPKMAAEARRRPLGRNGVVSPGGAAARRGAGRAGRGALGPTDAPPARCPRPPPACASARRPPSRPRGAGRALAGLRGVDLAPGGPRLSVACRWGASLGPRRPPPLPGSLNCSREAPSEGGGGAGPAPAALASAGRDLGGAQRSRRARRPQGLSPRGGRGPCSCCRRGAGSGGSAGIVAECEPLGSRKFGFLQSWALCARAG
ncbi:translation initiation factor IF-2-like [Phacochoerus africanus]|uniref:translation initiation factor IF-2-like n=1 Tax=Phacochoerus africanus TaxID=41426 RepID=UPI001FD8CCDA|nr:translation initiation factor IF-2-like [Phacochoerus africanus]